MDDEKKDSATVTAKEELKIELVKTRYKFSIGRFSIFLDINHNNSTITLESNIGKQEFVFYQSKTEDAKIITELMYEAVRFAEMKLYGKKR